MRQETEYIPHCAAPGPTKKKKKKKSSNIHWMEVETRFYIKYTKTVVY